MSAENSYIVITGADGFIGSYIVGFLNNSNIDNIIAVDLPQYKEKPRNLQQYKIKKYILKDQLASWLDDNYKLVSKIIHLGAISDTTEFNEKLLEEYNVEYSKMIWNKCAKFNIPLVYASSAATYGDGKEGYSDDEKLIPKLQALNQYGNSKQKFDLWAIRQKNQPPNWYGLKFFNVYGPNECHKGRMASVVRHAYKQIKETGKMKLFKSYKNEIPNGQQKRDFIFVDDIAKLIVWLFNVKVKNGIYNVGTGKARTFLDLVKATFKAMEITENIEFIEMPEDIKDKYQYFTEAEIGKLRGVGYKSDFTSIEDGVYKYIQFLRSKDDVI